jgi:putative molybdenum carrier protein
MDILYYRRNNMLKKIISGLQTGVDRAALDVCLENSFPCGGWCPKCRMAEDGVLSEDYPIISSSRDERFATEENILDSDGTLVITRGRPVGMTALSSVLAKRRGKYSLVLDVLRVANNETAVAIINKWIEENRIEILNIAGPKESRYPGMYITTRVIIEQLLK